MANVPPAIEVDSLVKSYGTRRAVDGMSLKVQSGEIFALLGPNGAGKTTLVETAEGYRRPDAGRVRVLGLDPFTQGARLKPRIGVMLQESGLYPSITPQEVLWLFGRYYRDPRPPAELLSLVGLQEAAETRYRRLSGGQKQRLALALALVGRPELVFLDEPTVGLDPQARRATWDLISRLQEEGVTILLTTHYLEEAERLADRVAIVHRGRLVAVGRPEELKHGDRTRVRLRTAAPVALDTLESLPSARGVRTDHDNTYLIDTPDAANLLVEITCRLRAARVPITELRVGQGSLEDIFLELTGSAFPT